MKGFFFALLILCAINAPSKAQRQFRIGVKAGLTSANQTFTFNGNGTTKEFSHTNGIRFGVFGELTNHQNISLITGLSYIQAGTKGKDFIVVPVAYFEEKLMEIEPQDLRYDYAALSAMAKIGHDFGMATPYFIFGLNLYYLVDANEQARAGLAYYNDFVTGFSAGAGTELNVGLSVPLILEFLYNRNISNAYEGSIYSMKNYSFDFLIGVKF